MLMKKISHLLPHHIPQMNEHISPGHVFLVQLTDFPVRAIKMGIGYHSHMHTYKLL
jgi:hypothetical protein